MQLRDRRLTAAISAVCARFNPPKTDETAGLCIIATKPPVCVFMSISYVAQPGSAVCEWCCTAADDLPCGTDVVLITHYSKYYMRRMCTRCMYDKARRRRASEYREAARAARTTRGCAARLRDGWARVRVMAIRCRRRVPATRSN